MVRFTLAVILCATVSSIARAEIVVDPAGDLLPTYSSGPANGDLDVLSSEVVFDRQANTLAFTATHADDIGLTDGALYVWGLDRGQGTERFLTGDPAIGAGVFFDSVLILRPDGTGSYVDLFNGGSVDLAPGSVSIDGGTIASTELPLSLFPSTGFAPEDYTWNLWPRVGLGANNQITDFAPDASNAGLTTVPEPASVVLVMFGAAAAAVGLVRRRLG
ncbi:PEP-CTERM sorting domain-containing protein [Aeoliella mucimassa]|uniref:Ice-binding protein C-terminal domain-containing protein n=1 Tax=Aeoliella mucimassa TaxID=2527972 RepID=A0A518AVU6_9BACT|nr:PEP-CTERM sorting domain-containing protein [Aeoliella mucimassa]QDU58857.1 hypothetical protein Pan181_50970 [Aeoliella mucimassa]